VAAENSKSRNNTQAITHLCDALRTMSGITGVLIKVIDQLVKEVQILQENSESQDRQLLHAVLDSPPETQQALRDYLLKMQEGQVVITSTPPESTNG